uniref:Association with the SNF1 complex (ASC) domain-containing protein n=2 Tax=Oryza meridionalis TaxID=40149 RepID=A0A0E0ERG4_9ORYZ
MEPKPPPILLLVVVLLLLTTRDARRQPAAAAAPPLPEIPAIGRPHAALPSPFPRSLCDFAFRNGASVAEESVFGWPSRGLLHQSLHPKDRQQSAFLIAMDRQVRGDHEGVNVVGFEVPTSPDSSYNNPVPGNEDEAREPPLVPPHLQHTLLSFPPSQDDSSSLPPPQNVVLNHLYIEKENSRSVVALGITHRFRAKFVTVVLYKPVQRR